MRSKVAEGGEDGVDYRVSDGHLGQLEGDGLGVARDTGADLDKIMLLCALCAL